MSANVFRRHLTAEQRREAIADYIKADPQASNRKVGKVLKVDGKTVASVRKESVKDAELPQTLHLPSARAEAELRKDASRSNRAIAKAAETTAPTVAKARRNWKRR